MLYKLSKTSDGFFAAIEPLAFQGLPKEKELEDLIAQNLWDVLFEGNDLMPIFQERAWQEEADIYALNKEGDLVIFELKRDSAGGGAVHQALRYCEKAARLRYEKLESMFRQYRPEANETLREEHQQAFELELPLEKSAFNRRQRLVIVGSAGDAELIRNVDYWKARGLWMDFIPYRIYHIGSDHYFEFFSLPYDRHSNPGQKKGVIFDTNRSYDHDAIWYMCEQSRVAAFGDIKGIVQSFNRGDTVFLYHKGFGIVAAGEVRGEVEADDSKNARYRKVKWLTRVPNRNEPITALSPSEITEIMQFGFYWAKTMKPPYLNSEESTKLLKALAEKLG